MNQWILLFLVVLTSCATDPPQKISKNPQKSIQNSRSTTPLTGSDIQIYFNNSVTGDGIRADLAKTIIDLLDRAEKSVDLAVYDFDLESIGRALVRARERKVAVRVILDNDWKKKGRKLLDLLDRGRVAWIDDTEDGSKGQKIMHHKFLVIDGRWVLTGSTNFTHSGIYGDLVDGQLRGTGNRNHIVVIRSPDLARVYSTQFRLMWGDGPGGRKDSKFKRKKGAHQLETVYTESEKIRIDVQFTPQSPKKFDGSFLDHLGRHLAGARRSIDFCQFVFSSQVIANVLEERSRQGVIIRGVGDRGFFRRYYSEFLDVQGKTADNPKKPGVPERDRYTGHPNRPWSQPIATVYAARTSKYDKLHHKYWIIDGEKVLTGSANTTGAAAFENDENYIIIYHRPTAQRFTGEFMARYEKAREKPKKRWKTGRRDRWIRR